MKKTNIFNGQPMILSTLLLALIFTFTGCSTNQTIAYAEPVNSVLAESSASELSDTTRQDSDRYSPEDLDDSWDKKTSTDIVLTGTSARISGSGASVSGNIVKITTAGTYILSGKLNDGQIIIDTNKDALVRLVLNGVTISNSTSAPIYAPQADKTIIILAEGTDNQLSDAASYVYAEGTDEPDAAIFAKDNLTITGTGSLYVTGNYNNAIGTKDDLCITNGNITVSAVNDGLRGRDSVSILNGVLVIEAQNDGIKSNNDADETKGFIALDGGQFKITAAHDGIQAETSLFISGGSFDILTGGGSTAAPLRQENFRAWGWNTPTTSEDNDSEDNESMKALKAGTAITIKGGEFVIDSEDDAVHANENVTILGGKFTISTGDDGFHADNALLINDGEINILTSYEGLEGLTVDINGGKIKVKAQDDGINAAGGNDAAAGAWGPMGGDRFSTNSDAYIRISSGEIEIDANDDGIDSNGKLYIDDGAVFISGPTSGGNSALDADGNIEVNGGTLVAAGSAGMLDIPKTSSAQANLVVYYSANQPAESIINLTNEAGNTIVTYAPSKVYQSIVISSPELQIGKKYTLYANNQKLCAINLTSAVTSVSDSGAEVTGRNGFGGGQGERPQGRQGDFLPPGGQDNLPPGGQGERPQGNGGPNERI